MLTQFNITQWALNAAGNGALRTLQNGAGSGNVHRQIIVSGAFGGTTLTFEVTVDNGTTWVPLTGVSITAPGVTSINLKVPGIRPVLTGGAGIDITVSLVS